MLKNPAIPIFAGLGGILAFWFGMTSTQDDFVGNMLPELIGFCLEGMFFIGIFTWLQERKEKERKQQLKQSLAGSVGFLCQLINSTLTTEQQVRLAPSENWARQARTNGDALARLLKALNTGALDVPPGEIQAIQQLLMTRLSTLDSLLSVSAELSHAHLSAYNMILTEIHKIAKHQYFTGEELKQSFISLMRLLISFNNEAL